MKSLLAFLLLPMLLFSGCAQRAETPTEPVDTPEVTTPVQPSTPEQIQKPSQSPISPTPTTPTPTDEPPSIPTPSPHPTPTPVTTPTPETINPDPNLPLAGFIIDYTKSNLNRPVREPGNEYAGPIFDTHAHLDPPSSGNINEDLLNEIIESVASAGVISMIVMPVPNEGHMTSSSLGAEQRIILRQIGGDKIKIFCGSEYISNWLHDIYRSGYNESELNDVLSRLSEDTDDPECSGVGEIGLYHFNKTGSQNVIEYPPTFAPYLRIIDLVAERGVWLDLHAEPVDPNGKSYEDQVFGGLELLFQKHPNLNLIISHTAMTNPTNVRRILETYPNIMMNFKTITNHNRWRNLEPITNLEGLLYNDWAELFEEMPDRFMVGTDEKFGRIHKEKRATEGVQVTKYEEDIKHMRNILGSISPDAAELIAYKNAERIFK